MKKRTLVSLVACLLMVCLLAACGGGASSTPAAGTAPAAPAAAPADTGEEVTLKYTYWGSTYEKEAMESAMADFMSLYPNIKVDAQHIPSDYDTKLAAMVAGNEAPDIGFLRDLQALPLAAEGKLVNILDLVDKDDDLDRDSYIENAYIYWEPGKAYGTFTALEMFGLYYNADLFEAAGVDPLPTKPEDAFTWDELVEVAKKLTVDQNGNTPNDPGFDRTQIRQYGLRFEHNQQTYMCMVKANGGDYVNADGTAFALTESPAAEALQKMADAINVAQVSPTPAEVKSIPAGAVSLISGQTAIYMGGQWNLLDLGESGVNFGVGILPKGAAGFASTGAQGSLSIFVSSPHQEEAYLLWKYLTNPESSLKLHQSGLWMPLMSSWYEEPLISEWADTLPAHPEGYRDALCTMATDYMTKNPSAYVKNFAKIDAVVLPAIERIFMGEGSAADILAEIEPQVNDLTDGRYDVG